MSQHRLTLAHGPRLVWAAAAITVVGVALGASTEIGALAVRALGDVTTAAASSGNGKGGGNNGNGVGNGPGGSQPPPKALLVDEVVTGTVRPGTPATVTVSVVNPNNQAVILTGISTELVVTAADGRTCAPASFTFSPVTGLSRRLEKFGTANLKDRTTVDLTLALPESNDNQDGCKGAELDLTYTATANRA